MRLADALGMRVISTDRLLGGAGLNHVLGQSHVVSLHVPLRRGEPALIGHDEIVAMRPQSFLLNVSRAGLVDEEAAIGAVGSGQLAGYAVDDRIQNRERAARLIEEGRIVESGHTAWYSDEAIERGLEEWVANIVALADGRPASIALRHSEVV